MDNRDFVRNSKLSRTKMKKMSIVFVVPIIVMFFCTSCVRTATTTSELEDLQDIVYKRAEPSTNSKAVNLLKTVFDPNYSGTQHAVGKVVFCGPFIWKKITDDQAVDSSTGIPLIMVVPTTRGNLQLRGRGIRLESDVWKIEAYIRTVLAKDGTFVIRKLNNKELRLYWAMIPYDIEEPIFILDSKNHKILVDFVDGKIMHVDDYQKASL